MILERLVEGRRACESFILWLLRMTTRGIQIYVRDIYIYQKKYNAFHFIDPFLFQVFDIFPLGIIDPINNEHKINYITLCIYIIKL